MACFGCGPANPKGLQLPSYEAETGTIAEFTPWPEHDNGPSGMPGSRQRLLEALAEIDVEMTHRVHVDLGARLICVRALRAGATESCSQIAANAGQVMSRARRPGE